MVRASRCVDGTAPLRVSFWHHNHARLPWISTNSTFVATSGRSSGHIDGRQHLAQIGDLRGCQFRQRLWVQNDTRFEWIATNSTIYSTATACEPVEAHCGKNRFSLAKKRPSERAKLVWGSPARATRGGSGTPYKKTASETTAIDALGGAKTRLYCPGGVVDN